MKEENLSSGRTLIGLDEAGYGPRLGPLVIAATVWSVPHEFGVNDFWRKLDSVITDKPRRGDSRLHVGDSKKVYSPSRGIASLEWPVWNLLKVSQSCGLRLSDVTKSDAFIREVTDGRLPEAFSRQPWYQDEPLSVPLKVDRLEDFATASLEEALKQEQIVLRQVRAVIICPERFNSLVSQYGNKSELLTRCSLALLSDVLPDAEEAVDVYADKHGGRNRYIPHLIEQFPDTFFRMEAESREQSRYRNGRMSLAFSTNSERYLPVALASMTAKYLRELCMESFNHFWQRHCPEVKPTKGYPVDAARFREEIQETWGTMGHPETILWRCR